MSAWKAAVAGAVGFAVGAGAMLMPGNQKMKKQVQKQVDKLSKMAKMWEAGAVPLHPGLRAMGAQGSRGT